MVLFGKKEEYLTKIEQLKTLKNQKLEEARKFILEKKKRPAGLRCMDVISYEKEIEHFQKKIEELGKDDNDEIKMDVVLRMMHISSGKTKTIVFDTDEITRLALDLVDKLSEELKMNF